MNSFFPKSLLASLSLLVMSASSVQAAVIVTLPTVSTPGSIEFTNDISFTVTTTSGVAGIVFDEWVTNDGTYDSLPSVSISPNALSYSKNGGPTQTINISSFTDNVTFNMGNISPNDGFLFLNSGVPVAVNDVFTLKAATYVLAANSLPASFNPQANQTFTGNAFLVSGSPGRLSANTSVGAAAVPEPSRALLLMAGLITLSFRRRGSRGEA